MFAQSFKAAPADPQQSTDVMSVLAAREALLSQTRRRTKPETFPHTHTKKGNSEIRHSPCDEDPENASA